MSVYVYDKLSEVVKFYQSFFYFLFIILKNSGVGPNTVTLNFHPPPTSKNQILYKPGQAMYSKKTPKKKPQLESHSPRPDHAHVKSR